LSVLVVNNLRKSYGRLTAVDGIRFAIEAGEIFGLLGPNGAGKSTTINVVASLLVPDGGEITINGRRWSAGADYKRRIGYVPQELSLEERLTARENLILFGRLYGLGGRDLKRRTDQTLETVGLADRRRDLVKTFSGGMKRRLNIAASLLHAPELLLLDEPTVGVDPQARAYIFELIERLAKEGRAVLYTTHYMEEAQRLCLRTAIIDHGRILASGTLSDLIARIKARRELTIEAEPLTGDAVSRLAKMLGDATWTLEGDRIARVNVADPAYSLVHAVRAADEVGIRPTSISIREPTLETVFLELTGRALRE